jgi:hypothetical protein
LDSGWQIHREGTNVFFSGGNILVEGKDGCSLMKRKEEMKRKEKMKE